MKKLSILLMLFAAFSGSICAQKLDDSLVPLPVKKAFSKQFPGLTAKWENENGEYEANFKQNGKSMSALFKKDGSITETEMDIKVTLLPAAVLDYVKAHYKGKNIQEAAKIIKADGAVNYETEVNGKDVIFDVNGGFIREAKD